MYIYDILQLPVEILNASPEQLAEIERIVDSIWNNEDLYDEVMEEYTTE